MSGFDSLHVYPTYDLDDIEAPFVGINHNTMLEEDLEIRTQEDKRIQTINLHNVTFADAILAGVLSANKRKRPDGSNVKGTRQVHCNNTGRNESWWS